MQYYIIGQIENNTVLPLTLNMNPSGVAETVVANANSFTPVWLLQENQDQAWRFSFSTNSGEASTANDMYIWYEFQGADYYLCWSRVAGGESHSVALPLPASPAILSISLEVQNDIIIVGTVDALIEEPHPITD